MSNPEIPDCSEAALPVVKPFTIASLQAHVFRWPVKRPVRTSFGTMSDRPAVLIRVEDGDGHVGWGEAWCNFPGCGAEHRARLLDTVVAPLLVGREFDSAVGPYEWATAQTAVLAIQSGEPGPIAQVVAGVDLAVWDLLARRAGEPLWKLLGGQQGRVEVYASGINPDGPEQVAQAKWAEGYRAFKLKVGFGESTDLRNARAMRDALPAGTRLMADANQGWTLDEARHMSEALREFDLHWLEEPLRADRPLQEWMDLKASASMPLAAGENLMGLPAFMQMAANHAVGVMQPDLAKWGGVSGCLSVIDTAHAFGLTYCPHYLGAGIGLLASAHLLAARGRPGGMLEVDANENPLRTALSPRLSTIHEGWADLGEEPGIGVEPDLGELKRLCG